MSGFASRYADAGLVVVAVDVKEDEATVAAFANDLAASFPIALDNDGSTAARWAAYALPVHYWIDAEGIVRDAALGGIGADVMARGVTTILPGSTSSRDRRGLDLGRDRRGTRALAAAAAAPRRGRLRRDAGGRFARSGGGPHRAVRATRPAPAGGPRHRPARAARGRDPDGPDGPNVASRARVGGIEYLGDHGLQSATLARGARAESIVAVVEPGFDGHAAPAEVLRRRGGRRARPPAVAVRRAQGRPVAFHVRQADDVAAAREAVLAAIERVEARDGSATTASRRIAAVGRSTCAPRVRAASARRSSASSSAIDRAPSWSSATT